MSVTKKHLAQVGEGMTLLDEDQIRQAIQLIRIVKERGGTMYLFGNGGSHATASHFANDLIKMGRVRAICVGDMAAAMLAYGNDEGWGRMFAGPLQGMLAAHLDGVVGISCSGDSANVIAGLNFAKAVPGVATIGLTGLGRSSAINALNLDVIIHAPVPDIRVQEDLHSIACHAIARSLQEE